MSKKSKISAPTKEEIDAHKSFVKTNDFNLQLLLTADLILLVLFFILIFRSTYKVLKERKKGKLGSETSLKYMIFFSTTTLLPSVLITIFSFVRREI